MFQFKVRFAALSLAAAASLALVSGASALPQQQQLNLQNKPNIQVKPNFNPNLKFAPKPKLPPVIVTPNPKFYPKSYYYPKYYPVVQPVQTIVEPVYMTKTVKQIVPVAAAATKPACLSKEITAEGLVIFRDTCTNEVATTAVPGTPAAAAMEAQQAALAQMNAPQVAASSAQTTGQTSAPADTSKF